MANYSTNIGGGNSGAFQGVSPVSPSNRKQEKQSAFLDLASKFAGGALKGASKAAGKEVSGVNQTNVEVRDTVNLFEDEVEIQQRAKEKELGREVDQAELADIKNQALSDLTATTREIKSLVASDRISRTEADARINALLSEKMSNPFLATFESDFMNTVSHYTGDVGISPTERQAKMKAQAEAQAQQEIYDSAYRRVQGGDMSMEQAMAASQSEMAFSQDTAAREARIKNGTLVDRDEINLTLSDSVNVMYQDLSNTVAKFVDKDGRINEEGMRAAKGDLEQWALKQNELIDSSRLSNEDKQYQKTRISETVASLDRMATEMSAGEFYANQKELQANYMDAEFFKNYPIASFFLRHQAGDIAKIAMYGGPQKTQLMNGLGIPVSRLNQMKKGTFFRGGIDGEVPTVPRNVGNYTEDDVIILGAAAEGQLPQLIETVGDNPSKVAYIQKLVEQQAGLKATVVSTPENAKKISEGDEGALELYNAGFENFRNNLTKWSNNGSTGEIEVKPIQSPGDGFRRSSLLRDLLSGGSDSREEKSTAAWKNNQLLNYSPNRLVWKGSEGTEDQGENIKDWYKTVYQVWKTDPSGYGSPVDMFNDMLAGNEATFEKISDKPAQEPTSDTDIYGDQEVFRNMEMNEDLEARRKEGKKRIKALSDEDLAKGIEEAQPSVRELLIEEQERRANG